MASRDVERERVRDVSMLNIQLMQHLVREGGHVRLSDSSNDLGAHS